MLMRMKRMRRAICHSLAMSMLSQALVVVKMTYRMMRMMSRWVDMLEMITMDMIMKVANVNIVFNCLGKLDDLDQDAEAK
jgi:hypothetical protein